MKIFLGCCHRYIVARSVGVTLLGFVAAIPICAQTLTVPRVVIEPAAPMEYDPFNVRVTFASPVCFSLTSPVYSNVSFKSGVLSLSLSHLKPGACAMERVLPVSGLPAGTHTVRVNITSAKATVASDPYYGGTTVETTVASTLVTINARADTIVTNVYTAEVGGDGIYQPFPVTEAGRGPVVLWLNHGEPVTGGGDWLDVGSPLLDGYTFKALRFLSPSPTPLPTPYEPLYFYNYPAPSPPGIFAATSQECLQLTRAWVTPSATKCPTAILYVLKYKNGTCPLGSTPVYRLFQPVSIAHRYTQSADTYSELQNYGFTGDGPVFCAPSRS